MAINRFVHETYGTNKVSASTWHETLRFDNPHATGYSTGNPVMTSMRFGRHVKAPRLELHMDEMLTRKDGKQIVRTISFGSIEGDDLLALRDFIDAAINTKGPTL